MKTTTPRQLCESYAKLYPGEIRLDSIKDMRLNEDAFGNWLDRYTITPEKALGGQNWYGKVTKALFHALALKQPKTKKEMLALLSD